MDSPTQTGNKQMKKYKVSIFPNVYEPENIHEYDVSFEQLFSFISKQRKKVKKELMVAWSPTIFYPKHRKAENAQYMYCMVLDVDQKTGPALQETYTEADTLEKIVVDWAYDYILRDLQHEKIKAIMHTSYSHSDEHHKFRIIFPLRNPIKADEKTWKPIYRAAVEWLHLTWSDGLSDKSTCDPSRAFYTSPHTDQFRADYIDGEYIDWIGKGDEYKERERIEQEKKRQEHENRLAIRRSHIENLDGKRQVTFSDHRRYMYDLLKYDYNARLSLASKLGARVIGNRAERWTCPACLRNDATYFYVNPTTATSLFCGHVNSCGDKKSPRYFSPGYIAEFYGIL